MGVECLGQRRNRLAVRAFSAVVAIDPSDSEAYRQRPPATGETGRRSARG